jgi:hypothetical protein
VSIRRNNSNWKHVSAGLCHHVDFCEGSQVKGGRVPVVHHNGRLLALTKYTCTVYQHHDALAMPRSLIVGARLRPAAG